MLQTAKQRVKMRKAAGFGSVLVVEQKTGVLKDRVANFENQGARKADLRLFDALALSKGYGVSVSELVGEDLTAEFQGAPDVQLSPLETRIARNAQALVAFKELLAVISDALVDYEQRTGVNTKKEYQSLRALLAPGFLQDLKEKRGRPRKSEKAE